MDIKWASPRKVAVGSLPRTSADVAALKKMGIRAVLSLHPVVWSIKSEMEKNGIEQVTEEVEDYAAPSPEQMDEFMKIIDAWLADDKPVYVHCYMGIGRSRTVAAAYLAMREGSIEYAYEAVGRPQTESQRAFVRSYINQRKGSPPLF